jgi:hypothetical protein
VAERVGLTSVDATAKQSLPPTKANENNQYFVYVFYTDPREADAKAVADALAAAGFRVTKVATKLIETKLKLRTIEGFGERDILILMQVSGARLSGTLPKIWEVAISTGMCLVKNRRLP